MLKPLQATWNLPQKWSGDRERVWGGKGAGRESWKGREVLKRIYNVQKYMLGYKQILPAIFHEHLEHECVLLNKGWWHIVKDLVEEYFYTATWDDCQGGLLKWKQTGEYYVINILMSTFLKRWHHSNLRIHLHRKSPKICSRPQIAPMEKMQWPELEGSLLWLG